MMLRTLYRFYAKVASFQVFFCWYSKCHPEANLNINKRIIYFCVESGEVIALLSPKRPRVMRVRGSSKKLQELCKWIQHCCATLRRSRNERNVGSFWLKSLTGFKLCATTRNNMQQGVQTDATCNIQQCWELLANNVASVCTGLKIS